MSCEHFRAGQHYEIKTSKTRPLLTNILNRDKESRVVFGITCSSVPKMFKHRTQRTVVIERVRAFHSTYKAVDTDCQQALSADQSGSESPYTEQNARGWASEAVVDWVLDQHRNQYASLTRIGWASALLGTSHRYEMTAKWVEVRSGYRIKSRTAEIRECPAMLLLDAVQSLHWKVGVMLVPQYQDIILQRPVYLRSDVSRKLVLTS